MTSQEMRARQNGHRRAAEGIEEVVIAACGRLGGVAEELGFLRLRLGDLYLCGFKAGLAAAEALRLEAQAKVLRLEAKELSVA